MAVEAESVGFRVSLDQTFQAKEATCAATYVKVERSLTMS